ncbi:UV-endonuclease [Anaerohalosphaera lusitana]|uniref:Endonuclease III n=1 Tax=Anaerohalosphaera lusitana TaxID=1936003 RepID=A0A1U9NH04_9BACT|nr:endonuclease III [Anaerohalosphaera lusitana]AQT67213.1 UV-endonuclease [Anaerohalosphaera lusitana]
MAKKAAKKKVKKTKKKAAGKKTHRKKIKVDPAQAKKRVEKIFPVLVEAYPDARVSLNFSNPLELLIATILAAQCTDARVNIVTADLFKKYRSAEDWANADEEELQQDIRSCGFYRNKAKSIQKTCRAIIDKFGGEVPYTMEGLLELNGVGRKTANVLLGNAFETQGIVCDTHVIRLSRRLALSENRDPVKLEFDLMQIVPKEKWGGWTMFSHVLVFHGRAICNARKPDCENCPIAKHCPSAGKPELW